MTRTTRDQASSRLELLGLAVLALILVLRFPVNFALYPPYLMDLEVYRAVAQRIAQGHASELYSPTTSSVMLFKYAPCWALFWLPLAWLPKQACAVLWASLTVLWTILACWLSGRLCRHAGLRVPPWVSGCVVVLLVRSVTAEFLNGQVDILWAVLVTGCLAAEASRRSWRAAVLLALAISLKLPALVVAVSLAVKRRWALLLKTTAAFLVLNLVLPAIGFFPYGLRAFRDWLGVLWSSAPSRAFEIGNQTLLSLLGRLLSADGYRLNIMSLSTPAIYLVFLIVSVVLLTIVMRRSKNPPLNRISQLGFDGALLSVLMVLCSPTAWVATYSALILPTTLAVACVWTRPRDTWCHWSSLLALGAMLALSLMTHSAFWRSVGVRYFRGESYVFLVLMILPWFGLALFGYLLHQRHVAARAT